MGALSAVKKFLGEKTTSIIPSYRALRRLIGILGMALPLVVVIGALAISGRPPQESISIYWYSNMRDFFVGLMFAVSLFLITYKGYDRLDFVVTVASGAFGLGIALFPCMNPAFPDDRVGLFLLEKPVSDAVHVVSALSFFILLGCNSLFLFTKGSGDGENAQKVKRNAVYRVSGIVILACVAAIAVCATALSPAQIAASRIVLILEAVALFAFGVSWLVKGDTLFRDRA